MPHPLEGYRLRFRNFKGFADDPGDWLEFRPITVLVGRNNSGKSAIIDGLRVLLSKGKAAIPEFNRAGNELSVEVTSLLEEQVLRQVFREDTSGGAIRALNHWYVGRPLVGQELARSFDAGWKGTWLNGPALDAIGANARESYQQQIIRSASTPSASLFTVAAERNVRPEGDGPARPVAADGTGLTNLIRAFLYDSQLPMSEVEVGLTADLNAVYQGDAHFERILSRRDQSGDWEIYLVEKGATPIRLSQSGSSLKSVFIILATIRLNPIVDPKSSVQDSVFCVEEPENNLHPSLLRRLLMFLAKSRQESNGSLVITTHSAAAIDWATRRDDAATYHVRRLPQGAVVGEAKEYLALRTLLQDLDIRASEILQANGVIWVEGPSDRLYVRKWIHQASGGAWQEGVHYSIMFYGGKLLSHLSALPPKEAAEAISLLRLNRNLILLMDSDRRRLKGGGFRAELNATKKRVISEAKTAGGYVWVTEGKEIENYISPRLLGRVTNGKVTTVDQYASVPDAVQPYAGDKIALAHGVGELMVEEDLDCLDLRNRIADLLAHIRVWNA